MGRMHPNDGRVVSNFVVQALQNKDITVYGDGSQTRSFCYVDDLIDGLVRLMETSDDVVGPFNLGNPEEFSVRDLAETIIALIGSSSRIVHRPLPEDDPKQRRPDISKAQVFLLWPQNPSLREGLRRVVVYFERLLPEQEPHAKGKNTRRCITAQHRSPPSSDGAYLS